MPQHAFRLRERSYDQPHKGKSRKRTSQFKPTDLQLQVARARVEGILAQRFSNGLQCSSQDDLVAQLFKYLRRPGALGPGRDAQKATIKQTLNLMTKEGSLDWWLDESPRVVMLSDRALQERTKRRQQQTVRSNPDRTVPAHRRRHPRSA